MYFIENEYKEKFKKNTDILVSTFEIFQDKNNETIMITYYKLPQNLQIQIVIIFMFIFSSIRRKKIQFFDRNVCVDRWPSHKISYKPRSRAHVNSIIITRVV